MKMRVSIVVEGLCSGGAERSACFLAEGFRQRGLDVSFVTVNAGENPFHLPPDDCESVDLGLVRAQMPFLPRHLAYHATLFRELRDSLLALRPDLVVSFGTKLNVMVLQALRGTAIPVIVSERGDPVTGRIEWTYRALRKILYPRAKAIVCLTSYAAGIYAKSLPGTRIVVIPNPLFPHFKQAGAETLPPRSGRPFILSVGRLSKQKNYPLLLEAFARLAPRYPDWDLVIYGEGKQAPPLKTLAGRLCIGERVFWPGVTLDLGPVYESAGLYVQPSLYEGFCNTLLEALAYGKAVAATNWGGVRDLVADGENGLLSPMEPLALAGVLDRLLADRTLRERLGAEARKSRERFTPGRIMDKWMDLAGEVTDSRN